MKSVRALSLLAVAAAALMAFAASASATTVTSPKGTPLALGSKIHAVSENGHVVLHNKIAKIECASTAEGTLEKNGEAGKPAVGTINILIFGTKETEGCTGGWVVHVNNPGKLSIHTITGTENGLLTSSEATVTATRLGLECLYKTNETEIGTVTAGEHATLDISAKIPLHGGSALCGTEPSAWTGQYKVTKPTNLYVSP